MNYQLIKYFNKALEAPFDLKKFNEINTQAMKAGYLIHPNCACSDDITTFIKEEGFNPNSTFYKTFLDVVERSELELTLDQVHHYLTTYGTDFKLRNGFVSNDKPPIIDFTKYKVIMPATEEDIYNEINETLKSGIALTENALSLFVNYLLTYGFLTKIDVDGIANKEAQAVLAVNTLKWPKDPIGSLRVIVYLFTGDSAMLIKSREVIDAISANADFLDKTKIPYITDIFESRKVELSTIFYRFKPLFLAMKNPSTAKYINKIRKLAVKNHKPLKVGFWEKVLNPDDKENAIKEATDKINEINSFKKAQLMQAINERLNTKEDGRLFVIRNGKAFVKEDYKSPCDVDYLKKLYNILEASIIEKLKEKSTIVEEVEGDNGEIVNSKRQLKIRLPKCVTLTLPTSEKNFIGNFPLGTTIDMPSKDAVIGIYWRNEWGANDFDLRYQDANGNRFGWNSRFAGKHIVFSGDMTNADPEAAECYYIEDEITNGTLSVSKFNGKDAAKFKLFIAVDPSKKDMENVSSIRENKAETAMVDPDKIVIDTIIPFNGNGDIMIAKIENGKIIMMNLSVGGSRRIPNQNLIDIMNKQLEIKAKSFVNLNDLLVKAGFEIVEEKGDLDISQMSKNDLIKLLS